MDDLLPWLPHLIALIATIITGLTAWTARKEKDAISSHLRAQADKLALEMRVEGMKRESELMGRVRELEKNKDECSRQLTSLRVQIEAVTISYQQTIEQERALRLTQAESSKRIQESLEQEIADLRQKYTEVKQENEELKRRLAELAQKVNDTGPLGGK